MISIANSPSAARAPGARSCLGLNGLSSLYYKASGLSPFGFGRFFRLFLRIVGRPKVRAPLGGQPFGLRQPPGLYLAVVAGSKHLWDRFALEYRRACVFRVLRQTEGGRFPRGGTVL